MFIFDCTRIISYEEYKRYLTSVKSNFDVRKADLFEQYQIWDGFTESFPDNYIAFRNQYRDLRQEVINNVLCRFRQYLPERCLIYEFGSLTKHTDRIESDTDLTICYNENKTDIFECVEELIDYTIAFVFEHSIDHIHGKFQHYPIDHQYDNLTEKDNLYILKFDNGSISYHCGPETLSENIMNIKNVRDYHSLIEGYGEKYALRCNIDCLYSIYILENTTDHDFLGDLAELENQNDIFDRFSYHKPAYAFEEQVEISYIKKALKNTIVSMYIMISYLRKRVQWLEQYSMTMEDVFESAALRDLFGVEYIEHLKQRFLLMLYYWDMIELLLKQNGVLLSTRCHRLFSKQELNAMLFQAYHTPEIMEKTERAINALNDSVSEGWRLISEKYG